MCVLAVSVAFTRDLFVLFRRWFSGWIRDVFLGVSSLVLVTFFVVGGKDCTRLDVCVLEIRVIRWGAVVVD